MSDDEKNITRTVLMAAPRTYRAQWREANAKAVTKVLDSEPLEVRTNINLFGSELYSLMQKPGPRFFGQIKTFVELFYFVRNITELTLNTESENREQASIRLLEEAHLLRKNKKIDSQEWMN